MGRSPNKDGEWSKKGRAEAIQTGVVYIQRYNYLSVCSVGTWEKSMILILKTNLVAVVHQTQIWIALKKVSEPLI